MYNRTLTAPILEIAKGPYQGTRESLAEYQAPDWFRDAKLGIWAHWGPQSAPEQGDWYAQQIYVEGTPAYRWHLQHFGHPSKVGYKDVIPTFKADKWEPDQLMDLYVKAGAKYFVSIGVHHDNFDMWNSKYQPRWNAVAAGPHKDIVGIWREAARKHGLRFGVSEHLSNSFDWFTAAHRCDTSGQYAGLSYDGADPAYADLYHSYEEMPPGFIENANPMSRSAPDSWKLHYFRRIKDLIDQHQPDLLYTDGPIPFEEYGLSLAAHHYNASAQRNGGHVDAIFNWKRPGDCAPISWPDPWQLDICVGNWHYKADIAYKTPKTVVDTLVDVVSRNGNLLLNFPLRGNGQLDDRELRIFSEITDWMTVNQEGIYATRPWKVYGDGASVRFTSKHNTVYAFVMDWPQQRTTIKPLALNSREQPGTIRNVEMLGHKSKLKWTQDNTGLQVDMPSEKPCDYAIALKISFA